MRYGVLAGVLVLVIGLGIALLRTERDVQARSDSERASEEAARARYDTALTQAAAVDARFAVSYVQIPLKVARHLIRRDYALVESDVARRLESGRPPVRPDFARLAGPRTDLGAQLFRERAVREREVYVVGLLVTQTTPGPAARMRLEVFRVALDSFVFVYDPLDLLPDNRGSLYAAAGSQRRASVEWTPRVDKPAFVPLSLLHSFSVLPTPAGIEYMSSGSRWLQTASYVIFSPRRLLVEREAGSGLDEIDISEALFSPVVLSTVATRP